MIPEDATLIAYFASFERGVLRELARAFPDLAPRLSAMADATEDLLPVARADQLPSSPSKLFGCPFGSAMPLSLKLRILRTLTERARLLRTRYLVASVRARK